VKEAAKAAKLQAKEEAKEAVKATKLQEKETAKAAKLQEKEDAKAAKLQEKEDAKAAKLQEKENNKLAKKEAKRLAAIAARAEAKASKVPRAKKNSSKSDIQEVVVLPREDIHDNVHDVHIQKPSCVSDTAVLEEEECIDVEEVCCNGVSYLLSSDNLVYDGGHEEVGRWCNGVVVLHSGDCVPRTPSLIQGTSQGTASPEPPL
jgi:hypothetical protein